MAQHLLGHLEVRNDAVAKRPRCRDMSGSTSDHPPCLRTHRIHAPTALIDRDDRRLEQHDPLSPPVHDRVRGPEIDSELRPPRKPAETQRPPPSKLPQTTKRP